MKKGMLEYCVLAVLTKGDSYGYQIIKDVSGCIQISESTLYPILRRLEKESCLETYSVAHNGRLRKYYRITEAGKQAIRAFLCDWEQIMKVYHFIEEADLA